MTWNAGASRVHASRLWFLKQCLLSSGLPGISTEREAPVRRSFLRRTVAPRAMRAAHQNRRPPPSESQFTGALPNVVLYDAVRSNRISRSETFGENPTSDTSVK